MLAIFRVGGLGGGGGMWGSCALKRASVRSESRIGRTPNRCEC